MNEETPLNFIDEIIANDIQSGKHTTITTRFPPEPNGYLHIGHAKSICLNFGLAKKYNGKTNLRFDDTNPSTEETEYVNSIKADIKWLGFQWTEELYTSDYFEQLYQFAETLIQKGLAYVDDSGSEDIAMQKGTPTAAGTGNIFRNRSVAENSTLFRAMKEGKYKDGEKILRAKIDMAATNMLLRDPIIYRIKHVAHHRTKNKWCLYPTYDFAHGQSDAIEKITHSICTLEFAPHRALYDWFIEHLQLFPSHQYEFARLNMTHVVMSKRKMLELVKGNFVNGWDDPRMPTLSGMRRRGYTPESIRTFCEKIGITKRENLIDYELLDFCIREHLNKIAARKMVVFAPLKIVITNYTKVEEILLSENNPEDGKNEHREIFFSKELYIERDDFMETPAPKYFRLAPNKMVRLKNAYIIQCNEVIKDAQGNVIELHCTYVPESKSGNDTSGIAVKGVLHWVSIPHAAPVELRLYDRLFTLENVADATEDFKNYINPNSLQIVNAYAEASLLQANEHERYQFMRKGYFYLDTDSTKQKLIFNRTTTLKDTWKSG